MMNADLSAWKVGKVTNLEDTFLDASKFSGTGLASWNTASATTLEGTFNGAREMNSDLSKWSVAKVTTMKGTFNEASKFAGTGLNSWITTSVTNLDSTFYKAGEMNSDLSKWSVAKVTTLEETFYSASKFAGTGLNSWITTSLTTMKGTFWGASLVNVDFGGWDVSRVTSLQYTFRSTVLVRLFSTPLPSARVLLYKHATPSHDASIVPHSLKSAWSKGPPPVLGLVTSLPVLGPTAVGFTS